MKEVTPAKRLQLSRNLEKNVTNYIHDQTAPDDDSDIFHDEEIDFFSDSNIFPIGSHNSFYMKDKNEDDLSAMEDATFLWVLEPNVEDFLKH